MDLPCTDGLEMTQDNEAGKRQTDVKDEQKEPVASSNTQRKSVCKRHGKISDTTEPASTSKTPQTDSGSDDDSKSDNTPAAEAKEATPASASKKGRKKGSVRKTKTKTRSKRTKHKKRVTDSEDEETTTVDEEGESSPLSSASDDSDSDSESDTLKGKKAKSKKRKVEPSSEDAASTGNEDTDEETQTAMFRQFLQLYRLKPERKSDKASSLNRAQKRIISQLKEPRKGKKKTKKCVAASKVAFKRVDQLWDQTLHDFKLTETADHQEADKFDQYIFTVRRRFDWEHKYQETLVDVRSKVLKEALTHVMDGVKSISLHVAVPKIDPNMLFLYLEDIRAYMNELKTAAKAGKDSKSAKAAATKAKHLKVLVRYLDQDYADIKKTLYPMLDNGTISFELLWALYKPNCIAYTSTYTDNDEPRAFKIDWATKECHFAKGVWYSVEGRYLDYSGKGFGMASIHCEVESFKGVRSITSLPCYPLKYRKDADTMRNALIERGKKFVTLKGMNYKHHKGMAYMKKKRQVIRICINGRVMIDPAIFRRINPNYPIGTVKPKDLDDEFFFLDEDEGGDSCCDCGASESESENDHGNGELEDTPKPKKAYKLIQDKNGRNQIVAVELDEDGTEPKQQEKLETLSNKKGSDSSNEEFTEEELLIASPVVLGFSFHEKLWVEFSVSGVGEVQWNEGAFESLVLPPNQKSIVRALVSAHKFHPSKNVDDIIANKGLGCCVVLHGPPGTGKTLTAEGIAELLKAPLYMVSAGELGTDPRTLERELQNILDIAHSWGAILLLDEADVFMEKRSLHDIHRNSLVGIFLRLLEYFQGILFLTTNRVETFDDAFQSRIHVALRYGDLDFNAKKSIWKMFISKIKAVPEAKLGKFEEHDFDKLARRQLNGRQIKNAARAAQALAVDQNKPLSMGHVEEVLKVAQSFEQDLKGGTGYEDAMRSYT